MRYRKLGGGFEVSVLALGTWQLADEAYWGAGSEGAEAVRAAIDMGITLFDTAEMYESGESEKRLGEALGSDRDRVLIASKVMSQNCAPALVRASCEASLRRLGTDRIDLYQVHWPSTEAPFADTAAEMLKLKDEGKIRAIGVSNFGRRHLDAWMSVGRAVSDQLAYNLLFRAVEYEILPACMRHNVGLLAYMPVMQGILADRWSRVEDIPVPRRRTRHFSSQREGTRHGEPGHEALLLQTLAELGELARQAGQPLATIAIAWLLAQPGVASVIVGGRRPDQIRRNLDALDLVLEPAMSVRLDGITQPLKEAMGPNADQWLGAGGGRVH